MNNKFASKGAMCILSFIALSAAAGSAFAQSAEFRRGYDEGYRDGIAAQGNQQQGGRAGHIVIEEAVYGARDGSCDARPAIQNAAGWRRQISIRADNTLCGDPAQERRKNLTVAYRCGDGGAQRVSVREGGTLTLSCR